MTKPLKISILVVATLMIAGLMAVLVSKQPAQILFYKYECPYCKVVEEYIVNNNVKNYLAFSELEVSANPINTQLLAKKAASCGLATDQIGVPFFFDGKNCYMGDQDIIKYFSDKK
jgi:glutaredoxin